MGLVPIGPVRLINPINPNLRKDFMDLKILMIGNSFSSSVLTYLPEMVRHEKKHNLTIANLYIGGCTLENHMIQLKKSQENPAHKPYWTNYPEDREVSLPDLIGAEKWDIVTIQQGSSESWNPDSFHPFADDLISYVGEHAPQAEIVIQQTWSYRNTDPRIALPNPEWGFDQTGMYERLTVNYQALAKQYGFRIIPTGAAVQAHRRAGGPDVAGKEGDHIHLNNAGDYLQACVWYGFLFGENPSGITFIPETLSPETVRALQKNAETALCGICAENR